MAPVLTVIGSGTPNYGEQGTPALVLAGLGSLHITASDQDGSALNGATITLGASAFAGDTLAISGTLPTGISIDVVNSTATKLVLKGFANLAAYEAALEQVTFSSSSDNPTNYGSTVAHRQLHRLTAWPPAARCRPLTVAPSTMRRSPPAGLGDRY